MTAELHNRGSEPKSFDEQLPVASTDEIMEAENPRLHTEVIRKQTDGNIAVQPSRRIVIVDAEQQDYHTEVTLGELPKRSDALRNFPQIEKWNKAIAALAHLAGVKLPEAPLPEQPRLGGVAIELVRYAGARGPVRLEEPTGRAPLSRPALQPQPRYFFDESAAQVTRNVDGRQHVIETIASNPQQLDYRPDSYHSIADIGLSAADLEKRDS